ncbi:MAG TPA: bifunctional riboflavin kinase/FAD synthetase [Candidatus Limnocylindrales bacterium]|nr:bifunctional riboflavin kinase/FAD synthetase [Candidatus Limnocylindrales bacterium]
MELFNDCSRFPIQNKPLFLALGNFDGVHRGHQTIIKAAIDTARRKNGISAALIFDPHPALMLHPEQPFALLTDIVERAEIMAELGLDALIVEPFTELLASLTAEQFVRDILVERLNVRGVFIGVDYSFGKQGAGNAQTMCNWGKKLNFQVNVAPMVTLNHKQVSSSMIRSLLLAGSVREASELLNYYFFRQGRVIKGHGLGSKIVYPTANISVAPNLIWPGDGVYLTAVDKLGYGMLLGVTNVGSQPTFSHNEMAVETYIVDFQGSIYSRDLRLYFLEKLRDVRAFASPDQLREQIGKDIEKSRMLIKTINRQESLFLNSIISG